MFKGGYAVIGIMYLIVFIIYITRGSYIVYKEVNKGETITTEKRIDIGSYFTFATVYLVIGIVYFVAQATDSQE